MGDVVMTIPVLRCLEKKYPNEKFIFVTRKKFAPFFTEFNNITFFEADFKNRHRGIFGLFRLFKDLKKTNPTKAADLHKQLDKKDSKAPPSPQQHDAAIRRRMALWSKSQPSLPRTAQPFGHGIPILF